jgi:hypothetical protein
MTKYSVIAATAVLAAYSLLMLLLSMHHSTRSAANSHSISGNGNGGSTGLGFHDGDI